MDVIPVQSHQVHTVWDWVEPILARVEIDNGFNTGDIFRALLSTDMQLWVVPEKAACVTTVQLYPRYKVLLVARVAGDGVEEWFDPLMDTLEDWARQLGCKYVEEFGRPGWKKLGKSRGYEQAFIVMRKAL